MIYFLLFLAVLFEGPVATLGAAMLAAKVSSPFQIEFVVPLAMFANLCADFFWYGLGRTGNSWLLNKLLTRSLGKLQTKVAVAKTHVRQHGILYFITAKLSLGVTVIPVLIATGMARFPMSKLVPVAICCEIIWTGTLACIGYFGMFGLGKTLLQLFNGEALYRPWLIGITSTLIALALVYLRYRVRRKVQ